MRTDLSVRPRGFTLVELMIVVAIIGVLAALAIYGVRRYLASSKTAEAKQSIGAIARASSAAYERENAQSEDLAEGQVSSTASHVLCLTPVTAPSVPGVLQLGTKYQPQTKAADFDTDSTQTGWKCLRFSITQPIYYQYWYAKDAAVAGSNNPAKCTANCYEALAFGDLNGNSVKSQFSMTGKINNGELKQATQLYIENEYE